MTQTMNQQTKVANALDITGQLAFLRQACQQQAGNAVLRHRLGKLEKDIGDYAAAVNTLTALGKQAPDYREHLSDLLECLRYLNQHEALRDLLPTLSQHARSAIDYKVLAKSLSDTKQLEAANEAFDKALHLFPDNAEIRCDYALHLLLNEQAESAKKTCLATLDSSPGHTTAIALLALSYRALGEFAQEDFIFNYDQLLCGRHLPTPTGYPDLQAFNRELLTLVQQNISLTEDPDGRATCHGRQCSSSLFDQNTKLTQALKASLAQCLEEYLHSFRENPALHGHPMREREATNTTISAGAVVLDAQGYQRPHIHAKQWISGVYYLQVPETHTESSIEFGQAPYHHESLKAREILCKAPVVGQLFIFPGFYYHNTLPFAPLEPNAKRVCIPFGIYTSERSETESV